VGRVWRITPDGAVGEVFRIPPMANEVNLVAGVGGIGRDVRTLGPGTITVTPTSRNAANALGSQPLVANGLQFDRRGNLYIADTARGAIWRVRFDSRGVMSSRMGCDTTFAPNTLCLSNVFVQHPYLEGIDGFVLDAAGNMWADSNERNAVMFISSNGNVQEIFRNPVNAATGLRNAGPLESPASPALAGNRLCTSNSDGNRRDNFPSTAGEIGGAGQPRGKISCLDQNVTIPGQRLPIGN
jgi:sugar lactone lactonase YvrE